MFIAATLLAVFIAVYAPVTGYGTAGANANIYVTGKSYSGCETYAARLVSSFSPASSNKLYFAASNAGAARMGYTRRIVNALPLSLALTATVCEFKAGAFRGTFNFKDANAGLLPAGKNITYDIPDSKFKAITQAAGLNGKTADDAKINVAYNIRYTPGRPVSGNRQAGGRVSGVGKQGYLNTGQCTVELKTHTLTPGKLALQITKFDFTDYRSTCKVPLFCA